MMNGVSNGGTKKPSESDEQSGTEKETESLTSLHTTQASQGQSDYQTLPTLDTLPLEDFLKVIGLRVRRQRSALGMSRKRLAEKSTVSERYLAQLEAGQGNISIALLRKVTVAIDMSIADLMKVEVPEATIGNLFQSRLNQEQDK